MFLEAKGRESPSRKEEGFPAGAGFGEGSRAEQKQGALHRKRDTTPF